MNYSGKRLSSVPYADVGIGMDVVSVTNTPGKVSEKFNRSHPSGNEWVSIKWANDGISIMPHATLTNVTVKEEDLNDPEIVKMFEDTIEEDVTAYTRPGEIIYQVTQIEMLKFVKKLLAREKKQQDESLHK